MEKALALAAALPVSPLQQQQQEPSQQPLVFRAGVTVRSVFVSVTDNKNRPVEGLVKEDFQLSESGPIREIVHFVPAGQPVPMDAILVVDSSASMDEDGRILRAREAAKSFIASLRPIDRAQIIDFDSAVKVLTEMTGDRSVLETGADSITSGGSTALNNAVYLALRNVAGAGTGRQTAIIVLTDGEDTSSLIEIGEVRELARRSSASVYVVMPKEVKDEGIGTVAAESGGYLVRTKDFSELSAVYGRLAAELKSKYQLGFYPGDDSIDRPVRVTLPRKRGMKVRATRAGAM